MSIMRFVRQDRAGARDQDHAMPGQVRDDLASAVELQVQMILLEWVARSRP
jgi:hypothetical protein